MLRSAQPSQFSTYPSQYIDTPGLAVLHCERQKLDNENKPKNTLQVGGDGKAVPALPSDCFI